jgi:hypothetical protein
MKVSTSYRIKKGVLLLLLTAVLWSLGGLWVKFIDWNPVAIAGARSLVVHPFTMAEIHVFLFTHRPHLYKRRICAAPNTSFFVARSLPVAHFYNRKGFPKLRNANVVFLDKPNRRCCSLQCAKGHHCPFRVLPAPVAKSVDL